jgi:DNA-binding Lrp family transcriptional regulator
MNVPEDQSKDLLQAAQDDFPLDMHPFRILGERLGLSEDKVLDLLETARGKGALRRIGASFRKERFAYVSTLVGLEVRQEELDSVARQLGAYPEITHCYERSAELNLWFTIIARSEERKNELVGLAAGLPGVMRCLDLPAKRLFKIDARFASTARRARKDEADS